MQQDRRGLRVLQVLLVLRDRRVLQVVLLVRRVLTASPEQQAPRDRVEQPAHKALPARRDRQEFKAQPDLQVAAVAAWELLSTPSQRVSARRSERSPEQAACTSI